MAHLLFVEDDEAIRELLTLHLSLVGHVCDAAEDAARARTMLSAGLPDLALLDVMLPGEDGFSLGEHLIGLGVPVLFLTAKTAVADRVRGLRMGAEDYILKPFEPAELLARVENILRRVHKADKTIAAGELLIDLEARRATLRGTEVPLTAMEFDLLAALARSRGVALSREELLRQVWGYVYTGESHTVDVHIQRLRSKLGPAYIETVFKYGYRFRAGEGDA